MRRLLCALLVVAATTVFVPSALGSLGLERFSEAATNASGSPDTQAGSHPHALTTTFTLSKPSLIETLLIPQGNLKDVRLELPPGLVGNTNATPKCSYTDFVSAGRCPDNTVVGVATTYFDAQEEIQYVDDSVYNIEPPSGVAAEFGFLGANIVPVLLDASVRTGGDYGVTVNVRNISQAVGVTAAKVTIWGVPGDASHDALRGHCLRVVNERGETGLGVGEDEQEGPAESLGNCPADVPAVPLLMNPTSCGVPRTATLSVDSWEAPGHFVSGTATLPEVSGCDKLSFSPTIAVASDEPEANTPMGLRIGMHVPQEAMLNPMGLAAAHVKDTRVTLPVGVRLNPSAADGLLACSSAQIALENGAKPSCPDASKLANVTIRTPVLPDPLEGGVYLAAPQNFAGPLENPFGSLIALYLVAEDPAAGVLVKLAGRVALDPVTGQVVATFDNAPQLPFSDLDVHFFGGARAPLTSPRACGSYSAETSITPWSGGTAVSGAAEFAITAGPDATLCQSPGFVPAFSAGTSNNQAGAFSPFSVTFRRTDQDQEVGGITVRTPPGLLGNVSRVAQCREPEASKGTCSAGSQIGHVITGAGSGTDPIFLPQAGKAEDPVYLTGPYRGAPFGLSIVVPAQAGPFDLGTVVVRASIHIDPHTAQITVTSDPLPTTLQGIPLDIRAVNVTIDRAGLKLNQFMFNPTNCEPTQISATLTSLAGASVGTGSRFQAANCANLPFKPTFAATTAANGNFHGASLDVKISQKPGEAAIHKVDTQLPLALPSRLVTLQKACTEGQFAANPAGCPAGSNVGIATAITPVLNVPLTGPAYLVSHGGAAFPDLDIVLQGEGVKIILVGNTDIKKGITYSRFETVPDAPISSFELKLPGGPGAVLAATKNLCAPTKTVMVRKRFTRHVHGRTVHYFKKINKLVAEPLLMPTTITGQNGAVVQQPTKVAVTGCRKTKPKPAKHKKKNAPHKKK